MSGPADGIRDDFVIQKDEDESQEPTLEERVADSRNETERLLNVAMDHIASTLEQPTDQRAWDHLLIYCPRDALERRLQVLRHKLGKHNA